jgi:hypothetical protein
MLPALPHLQPTEGRNIASSSLPHSLPPSLWTQHRENKKNLGPAHGAGGVPIEPGGDAVLAEDVLALQHGRLLVGILQQRLINTHTFYRLQD